MKSIKNIRAKFKEQGVFYTPEALALKLKSYIDNNPKTVYDPTCGAGNLLKVFDDGVKKYGQELDAEELASIDIPNFTGYAGNTLTDDKVKGLKFDAIVANPPFSVKWKPEKVQNDERFKDCGILPPPSKADWAFMLHILHHLSDGGVASVLEFPGTLYRGNKEYKIRRWFLENNYIERVVTVAPNTFEDTATATCIYVIRKNKKDADVIFENEKRCVKTGIDEIAENDFNLSENAYMPPIEEKKENIDPNGLQAEARQKMIGALRKDLQADKVVCELENMSQTPYLNELASVVNEFREAEE